MYEMAKEGIITDPDQRECTKNIEDILFWTIRTTVISTALNPLLYGFLAQQYRGAYVYLLKLLFSKCCLCVSPPTKNVFCKWIYKCASTYANNSMHGNFLSVCIMRMHNYCKCMHPGQVSSLGNVLKL